MSGRHVRAGSPPRAWYRLLDLIGLPWHPRQGRHQMSWTQIMARISLTHTKALYELTPYDVPFLRLAREVDRLMFEDPIFDKHEKVDS